MAKKTKASKATTGDATGTAAANDETGQAAVIPAAGTAGGPAPNSREAWGATAEEIEKRGAASKVAARRPAEAPAEAKPFTPKGDVDVMTTGGAPRYTLFGSTMIKNKPTTFSPKSFTPDQWGAMKANPSIRLTKAATDEEL